MFKDLIEQEDAFELLESYAVSKDVVNLNFEPAFGDKINTLAIKIWMYETTKKFDHAGGKMSYQRTLVMLLAKLLKESITPEILNKNLVKIKELLYKAWVISLDISLDNAYLITGNHLKNISGGRKSSSKTHGTDEEKEKNREKFKKMVAETIDKNPSIKSYEDIKRLVICSTENKALTGNAKATIGKLNRYVPDPRKIKK